MSATATDQPAMLDDDSAAKRMALRLALATALGGANAAVVFATGAIVGQMLAPNPSLATLPLSIFVVGMACGTLPVGAISRRYGRRIAFRFGCSAGAICGLLASLAIYIASFPLFCCATFCGGFYAAAAQSYRFAAADSASPGFRAKALSWVMVGGIFAAFVGPQLVQLTMGIWPHHLFALSYLAQSGVALLAMWLLNGVVSPPVPAASLEGARPLWTIVRQSHFITAAVCGTVSYALMNLLMTSAPLAMKICGLSLTQSNLGIQWHILAMYGPSLITGKLIARFGAMPIVVTGLVIELAAALTGLSGQSVWHFWGCLVLIGLGWNFGFVGASAMVLDTHLQSERNKVQSFNDFIVFGTMAVGSFLSGHVLADYGWGAVNAIVFPCVLIAAATIIASRVRTLKTTEPRTNPGF